MRDQFESPLIQRYASKEMSFLFSPQFKFQTWRKLWIILAESEKELGLPITEEQIEELKAHDTDINLKTLGLKPTGTIKKEFLLLLGKLFQSPYFLMQNTIE
jgi:hypothetical protein